MRINKYVALATGISRRKADDVIASGQVKINGTPATTGSAVSEQDIVTIINKRLSLPIFTTILLNKPTGYVCSRNGQGSKTIYNLLPEKYHNLKPIGRLDKYSSGLLLLTNNGALHQKLCHPSYAKQKRYIVTLNKPLLPQDQNNIIKGVMLEDGISKLQLQKNDKSWIVTMAEGRNRQIRRTFSALGYKVTALNRTNFGPYKLSDIPKNHMIIEIK